MCNYIIKYDKIGSFVGGGGGIPGPGTPGIRDRIKYMGKIINCLELYAF